MYLGQVNKFEELLIKILRNRNIKWILAPSEKDMSDKFYLLPFKKMNIMLGWAQFPPAFCLCLSTKFSSIFVKHKLGVELSGKTVGSVQFKTVQHIQNSRFVIFLF